MIPDLRLELETARAVILAASPENGLRVLEQQARRIATFDQFDSDQIVAGLCDIASSMGERESVEHIIKSGMSDQSAFLNGHGLSSPVPILPKLPPIRTRDVFEFMHAQFPHRETILSPWLPTAGVAMCYAPRGGCKPT